MPALAGRKLCSLLSLLAGPPTGAVGAAQAGTPILASGWNSPGVLPIGAVERLIDRCTGRHTTFGPGGVFHRTSRPSRGHQTTCRPERMARRRGCVFHGVHPFFAPLVNHDARNDRRERGKCREKRNRAWDIYAIMPIKPIPTIPMRTISEAP